MKPVGGLRRERVGEVRHNMPGHIMAFRGRRASLRWKAVNE